MPSRTGDAAKDSSHTPPSFPTHTGLFDYLIVTSSDVNRRSAPHGKSSLLPLPHLPLEPDPSHESIYHSLDAAGRQSSFAAAVPPPCTCPALRLVTRLLPAWRACRFIFITTRFSPTVSHPHSDPPFSPLVFQLQRHHHGRGSDNHVYPDSGKTSPLILRW